MKRDTYMVKALRESFGSQSVTGVEIGVFQGAHAEIILTHLNIATLYLIDPYVSDDPNFEGHLKPRIVAAKDYARQYLEPFSDKIVWLVMTSDEAVDKIPPPLDFVYIDGNHSYDYVMRDMRHYIELVKPGGWLGGHDYMMRRRPLIAVKQAVDDYVAETGLSLNVGPGKFPEWWLRKEM